MKHVLLPDVHPSWARRWHDLLALVPRRRFFAEVLDCGFFLARPSYTGLSLESGPKQFREALIDWIRGTEPGVPPDDLGIDAIFFCHSPSAHLREPVRELARQVRDAGYRCLVWHDNERELFLPAGADEARLKEALDEFLESPLSPAKRIATVLRALLQAAYLTARLGGKRAASLRDLWRRPARWWAALVDSGLRMQRAATLLDATGAALLFTTHERFRPASSFFLARHRPRPTTLLYHHGLVSWYEQPILSDEVLTWNRTDAAEVRAASPQVRVHVTGNWELERLPFIPLAAPPARRELLFLSQYLREDEPCFRESTVEALTWLREVARERPEWKFLVKPRGPEDEIGRLLGKLPENIALVHAPFPELLARPGLRSVAAFSSSGLYVAAGCGKQALRLRVRHHRLAMPLLDEICTPIQNAREWARALDEAPSLSTISDEFFLARGSAVERAAAICVAKLAISRRAGTRESAVLDTAPMEA